MRRAGKALLILVVVLPLLLATAIAVLAFTERGLHMGLQLAAHVARGDLRWDAASGRIAGPLRIEGLEYRDDGLYRIGTLELDWQPGLLLQGRLSIARLHARDIGIELAEAGEAAPETPLEPGWDLPFGIDLDEVDVQGVRIRTAGAEAPIRIDAMRARIRGDGDQLDVGELSVLAEDAELHVRGRLGLGADTPTDLSIDWRATPPGYAPLAAQGTLTGRWGELRLAQRFSAPAGIELDATLIDPFAELRWTLELGAPVTSLTTINPAWPAQRVGGRLSAAGGRDAAEAHAALETDWAAEQVYPLQLDLDIARGGDGEVRVNVLNLQQADARVAMTGQWHPAQAEFAVRLGAQRLRWPLVEAPQVRIPQAELHAAGRLDDYRLDLNAQLRGAAFPAADLEGQALGDGDGLRIERLVARTLDGRVETAGRVAWSPAPAWDLRLTAEQLDPGHHWPDWSGRLSARLASRGARDGGILAMDARIETLTGDLRGYPVNGGGAFGLRGDEVRIEALQLRSGDAALDLDGTVGERWSLAWQLHAPKLQQLVPAGSGRLEARGDLSGARAAPRLQAHVQAQTLALGEARIDALQIDADAGLEAGASLQLGIRGTGLHWAERRLSTLSVDLDGQLERHALTLRAQGPGHRAKLDAQGGWDGALWTGRLERADWLLPETGAWSLAEPADLRLARERGDAEGLCWHQSPARLCLTLGYQPEERRADVRLTDWPLTALQTALPPNVSVRDTALSAQLNAVLPTDGVVHAEARLDLSPGQVGWQRTGRPVESAFGGAELTARLDAEGARAQGELRLTGDDRFDLSARLPGFQPGIDPAGQALRGELRGAIRDFSLLDAFTDVLDEPSGVLHVDLGLSGTLAAPELQGELRMSEGRVFVGPAGIQLEDWELRLTSDPDAGRLNLQSTARSGPGRVALEGWLSEFGSTRVSGELQVAGADFEAIDLPEARVLVTPDLRASLRAREIAVTGAVTIPQARIEPRDVSGAVTPSDDVVLVAEDEPGAPPGWIIASRVRVGLGERVRFDGYGLTGRLTGAVEVTDVPNRVPTASGELAVKDGVYRAYGRELQIEEGRVLYRDSPLDNPGVDVRAVRKTGEVLAGVRVLGTAQDPQAELFSEPAMSQADALSYLLLGRPVSRASGGEGELLVQAATSLGLKGGNLLAESIGNAFGLDEVSVGGGDDLESAALTVGKYLSPRLYLNYSVGLLDAANRLQMRYQLSERLSVQTETGTATGGDLLYTIER